MSSTILDSNTLAEQALSSTDEEVFTSLLDMSLEDGVPRKGFRYTLIPSASKEATIKISVDRSKADVSIWPNAGEFELSYKRIGLSDLTSVRGNVVRLTLPATKRDVAKQLFEQNEFHDRSASIVDGVVADFGDVELECDDNSLLLYGSTLIDFRHEQFPIYEVVKLSTLDGFREPSNFTSHFMTELTDQLLAVNSASMPFPVDITQMSLSQIEQVSEYAHDNTTAILEGFGDNIYIGEIEITYSRLNFAWYTLGTQYYVEGPSVVSVDAIIDAVTTQSGFPLTRDDIVIPNFPSIVQGELDTLTILFKPDNPRYVGELTVDYRAV